jgi:hypothetical protein
MVKSELDTLCSKCSRILGEHLISEVRGLSLLCPQPKEVKITSKIFTGLMLTAEELNSRFKGKQVVVNGLYSDINCGSFRNPPCMFKEAFIFPAAGYMVFVTENYSYSSYYWREDKEGKVYGIQQPNANSALFCIELAK